MRGHISQVNTQRISIHLFRTIKASSGDYRYVWFTINLAIIEDLLYNIEDRRAA